MKLTGPQIIGELREKLPVGVGRHLYAVLGAYSRLAQFEQANLGAARTPEGTPFQGTAFPRPVNLNRELLARIGDEDLRRLVRDEARRPEAVQRRLNQELDDLVSELLREQCFLVVKQIELLFAYQLDLTIFRTRATNLNHILLLLPGQRISEHVVLFHEADARFHRTLPENLIAENHLWELVNG